MWKKLVSGLLAAVLLVSGVPVSALSIESDWIVEFGTEQAAADYLSTHDGRLLGGPMVLTRGTRSDFDFMPGVISLTEDSAVKGAAVAVNDPRTAEQSYLSDRAFNPYGGGWEYLSEALAAQNLTEADASPVKVAVIDTGVDGSHPDLVNRVTDGYDVVNSMALPAGADSDVSAQSHGTMVAGLIAAEADNNEGIAGLSYTLPVSVVPVRALDASANGKLSDIISAIYWAVDEGGADIINMSFGIRMKTRPAALETAVRHAVDENVMLVAAAGNEGRTVTYRNYNYYPAAMEGVLAVGSVTAAQYSRYYGYVPYYADFTNQLSSEDAAYVGKSFFYVPGEELLTTVRNGGYDQFTGTSASAAVFAGMMASLMSVSRATGGIDPLAAVSTSSGGGYYGAKYHSFYTAAYNLANGRSVDAWWVGDYHQPSILRGSVNVTGTLMDPSHKMQSVRVDLVNEAGEVTALYSDARAVDTASQNVSFDIETTRYADGDYHYDIIAAYASDGSEITLATVHFTIDNGGRNYLLSARENGETLIGAEVAIYDGSGSLLQDGMTDSLGNFPVNAAAADKGGLVAMLRGEENLFLYELEQHPRNNAYSFSGEPTTLTVTASAQSLIKVQDAPLMLTLPGGETAELATVTSGSTAASVCTNMPLTFTVKGDTVVLTKEFSLAGGDQQWNLDEALASCVTLTVNNAFADADGVKLTVGGSTYTLPKAGGEVMVMPGAYDVSATIYKLDDSGTEGFFFKVNFGRMTLSENRTLSVGASVRAEVTLAQDNVVQNQEMPVRLTLRDSEGSAVSDVGGMYNVGDEYETVYSRINNYSLQLNRYHADDDTWEDLDNQYVEWKRQNDGEWSAVLTTSVMENEAGAYRLRLHSYEPWPFEPGEDDWYTFTVSVEETRPSARVNFRFINLSGYQASGANFYVLLKDSAGQWISRKAMTPANYWNEDCYTYLPVGETYRAAMMAYCYSDTLGSNAAVAATFTVDLTGAAAGDTVDLTVQPEDTWPLTRFTDSIGTNDETDVPVDQSDMPASVDVGESDDTDYVNYVVSDVTVYPFAELPEAGAALNREIAVDGILSDGIGETDVDCILRANEDYYMTDATVRIHHDLRAGGSIALGLPLNPTLACDREEYYSGSDVTLQYTLLDRCGNAVRNITCDVESKYDEERAAADRPGRSDASLETSAYVTVRRSNGTLVGQYDLSDICAGSVKLTGLADGIYTASATVKANLLDRTGETVTFTVGGEAPAEPEKTVESPRDFVAKAESVSTIALSWNAPDEPEGTVAGYVIYRDGKPFAETAADRTAFTDSGITADRYYTYTLYAVDGEGTMSEGVLAGSRPAGRPDTQAPTVPNGLQAVLNGSEIVLTWNRSIDNIAVTNYIVTCGGEEIGRTYNRRFVQSGFMPGATGTFTVSAIDGAGNRSAESAAVSVTVPDVSGITAASLTYSKNKAGNITGTSLVVNAKATADITSAKMLVSFTLTDGTPDSRTVSLGAGKNGAFLGSVSLPDEYMTVEQVTLTAYRSGETEAADSRELLDAAITRANEVTLTLTNTHHIELPDFAEQVNVTLKGNGGKYAVTRTVENFSGSAACFPPNAADYTFTVTDDDGRELYVKSGLTVSNGGAFTADLSELAPSLRVKLVGLPDGVSPAGLNVNVRLKKQAVTGTADAAGYVLWPTGGRWLSVEKKDCYQDDVGSYITLNSGYQSLTTDEKVHDVNAIYRDVYLTDPVNEITVSLNTSESPVKTVTATVVDRKGNPVPGVAVDFAGKSSAKALTDANGVASAQVDVHTYTWGSETYIGSIGVSVPAQTGTDGRIWEKNNGSYAAAPSYSGRLTLTQLSNQLRLSPVLTVLEGDTAVPVSDSDAAEATLSVTVRKNYSSPYSLSQTDGAWANSDLTLRDGDFMMVRVRAVLGSRAWTGTYSGAFDADNPAISPEITLREDVMRRVTLTSSDKGILPGVSRRFIVFDTNSNQISDTVTRAAFTSVKLPYGERVYIVATFDTESDYTLAQWKNCGKWAHIMDYTAGDNAEPLTFSAAYGAAFDSLFWQENGYFGGLTQYRLDNGDWQMKFRYTAYKAAGATGKKDYIILPENAYDVKLGDAAFCSSYDEDTHTITIEQSKIPGTYAICNFAFTVSPDDLAANPRLLLWFECQFSNEHYVSKARSLHLRTTDVMLGGASGVDYNDLTDEGGYLLTVRSQKIYGTDCTLTVYDGDVLLLHQFMPSMEVTVDLPLVKDIGSHTLRAVVDNGRYTSEATKTVEVSYHSAVILTSAQAILNYNSIDLLHPGGNISYLRRSSMPVSASVTVKEPELVKKMWLRVTTSSGRQIDVALSPSDNNGALFIGQAMLNLGGDPIINLLLDWEEVDTSGPDQVISSYETSGSDEYRQLYDGEETPERILTPDDAQALVTQLQSLMGDAAQTDEVSRVSREGQTQALGDWEKYKSLVYGSRSMTDDQFNAALDDLYGQDGIWSLPTVRCSDDNPAQTVTMTYIQNSSRAEAFLNSDNAFTMLVNGEKRKCGVEIVQSGDDAYIHIYGMNDLLLPPVPQPEGVSGAGWWRPVIVNNPFAELIVQVTELALGIIGNIQMPQPEPDPQTEGDPCEGGTGEGGGPDENRQKIIDRFNTGKALAKDEATLISSTLGLFGLGDFGAGWFAGGFPGVDGLIDKIFESEMQRMLSQYDMLKSLLNDGPPPTDPCDPEEPPGTPPGGGEGEPGGGSGGFGTSVSPLVDPSGIIHEAVADEPVQGVTASIYYRDSASGEWVLWDSEAYDQNPNPMLSMANGYYGWDVLYGKWKVVFEKDGYFLAESEELDVPPEHTDVNISLVSSLAPQVKEFTAKADGGSVTLTFDKYMLTEDILRDGAVTVTFGGVVPDGELTAVNPKTTAAGNKQAVSASDIAGGTEVAKQFVYTFSDPLPTGATVNITVSDEAAAYNGMTLTERYNGSAVVPDSDPVVYADDMAFEDGTQLEKTVGDTFAIGSLTFNGEQPGTVRYASSDESVITVDESGNVTAVGVGYATVWARCDTLEAGRPVQVTRKPSIPDETDNAVVFCREHNLIRNKGCWMWSDAANFDIETPMEGDGKYLAVSWRILENGVEKAGETLEEGLYAVKEYYIPTETGTLTGEITYQYYTYHEGVWVKADGKTYTAKKEMPVVTVTGLSVKTPPAAVGAGDTLSLSELVLNVHTSDGLVSEVPYAKFGRWNMQLSTQDGTVLTKNDRVLTVTHPDSGSAVAVELWAATEHSVTVTTNGHGSAAASVEKADPGDIVTLTATPDAHYRLKEWKVVTGHITIANHQFTMPETAVSIQAVFAPDHHLTHTAAVAATCETDGHIEYWHCAECGRYFADAAATTEITEAQTVVTRLGHDWDEGAVVQAATCETDGTKVYTCRHDAGHTKTEILPALGHRLTLIPAVAATCENDGHAAYYVCEHCGRLFADGTAVIEITDPGSLTVPAPGHDWSDWTQTLAATEDAEGEETRTCSRDASHVQTRAIPKLPHTHALTLVEAEAPTCEADGHIAYYTCRCGHWFADAAATTEISREDTVVSRLGHDWDNGVITTEPACDTEGEMTYTCQRDASYTKTAPIPALGHKLTLVAAAAAACEADGHTAYYTCERCGRLFRDAAGSQAISPADTVIPALGHDYGAPVWTWTDGNDATVTLVCSHDAAHTKVIPAAVTSKTTDPTCETDGETVFTATVTFGGVTYTDEKTLTVPAAGHRLTLVAAVEPTCETDGTKAYYRCDTCGKWFADATASVEITDRSSVLIPAAGHDYGNPAWTWSADGKAALTLTCSHDASHVRTVTANVTSVTSAATCESAGRTVYTATAVFGGQTYSDTQTVTLAALGHGLHLVSAVPATCEKDGHIAYYLCERCRKLFADADGTEEITLEDTVIPAKEHDWNGGVVTTEPTCTDEGVKTFTCLNDPNHTRTEAVPALGHSLTANPEIPAACETAGRKAYYECSRCGKCYADSNGLLEIAAPEALVIPATGHAYGAPTWQWHDDHTADAVFVCKHDARHTEVMRATVTADQSGADCEHAGRIVYTAAVIFGGQTYTDRMTESVPALGHSLTLIRAAEATCEVDGHTDYYICAHCGKLFADADGAEEMTESDVTIPAFGHDWDDGVITSAPTCDKAGVKTFTCRRDAAHIRTEEIPAAGHQLHFVPAADATCGTDGHLAYYECETCGKRFADGTAAVEITGDVTIAAFGHDWGVWFVQKAATETEDGEEMRICRHDPSHVETRVIPMLSHVHKLTATAAKPATCEADGHIAYWTCEGCGKYFEDAAGAVAVNPEDTVLRKLGHDWDEGIVTTQPTCETDGVKTFICGRDPRHIRTEPIPAFGHTLRFVPAIPAACESDGSKAYYECEICGKRFADGEGMTAVSASDLTVAAIGHDWDNGVTRQAENGVDWIRVFTCKHDPAHLRIEPLPAEDPVERYAFCAGMDVSWTNGSSESVLFIVRRVENDDLAFRRFIGIEVDGQGVLPKYYTAEAGSVRITLNPLYLETLAEGTHTLTALFTDGSAETTFTVLARRKPEKPALPAPQTGEPGTVPWFMALLLSLTVMFVTLENRQKRKRFRRAK